ncbi:MAG: 2-C-methyl-D-erythritol 4-phosphate cytidylyltransferase [Dehalococcoidia bacterium]|nr:2-C-methyl-D-erythritol 4-phosphate cytidylyltransferase [Dehalococcoidia bacterium]
MKPETIAIIPARGGSKGIPKKNSRLLCGKPLIAYTIEVALSSRYIDRVLVSTEDEEIAEISRIYGADVIPRPLELAQDEVTLDPVIFHAVNAIEREESKRYEFVVTLQPTSPLLSKKTLNRALNMMHGEHYDTLISVVRQAHIYWMLNNGAPVPLYKERRNRQQLEPIFRETGTLLVCKRKIMSHETRIGKHVYLFEIPEEEAIDIDNYADWLIAENLLKRLSIVFRVDGDERIGLGHVCRTLTLANRIFNHNTSFLTDESKKLGLSKLREHNYPVFTFEHQDELFETLEKLKPDIIINDILDTDKGYVHKLRDKGLFVVNFEDLGPGVEFANIVVNALYENSYPAPNHYYGHRYLCLRDEFHIFPAPKIKSCVKNILLTFGGVDENNITYRTLHAIENIGLKDIRIIVILGIGYSYKDKLHAYINTLKQKGFNIELKEDVSMMAKYMVNADVVITSNGRTLYEIASLGIPCISISQNEREARHLFAQICKGILNLGMASNVSEDTIASGLSKVIEDYHLREEMSQNMLKFDLKEGIDRTLRLIFDGYYDWKEKQFIYSRDRD